MRPARSAGLGLGLALLSAATFGTSGTLARSLIDAGWSAGAAVAVRVGVASLILAVPAALSLRGRWDVARRSLTDVGLFGLLAVGGAQLGFFNAVRYLPVGVALLLEYSGILLVMLWMWLRHGERPRRLTIAGAVAAVIGLSLVLDVTGDARIDPVGVLWGLMAAVGLATYFVLSARVHPELPSVALACGGMAFGAVVLVLLGVIGVLPLAATFGSVDFAGHRTSWLLPTAGLVLVAAVIAYVSGIGAARILGAALSSFVGLTEVLFAVLIAWLVLDELPGVMQLIGGAFVVAGIALVRLDQLPGRQPASEEPAEAAAGV
ncbi:EamA family transporter [Nucisporomicrobium flavum]|uniref:EamA family transporter n=1 Tax=Nucisporomicrobium flavum TaxID=2785915 RepID=UPI0018F6B635|nr:EamA family transporter [Nucisporomicrobium flavum]